MVSFGWFAYLVSLRASPTITISLFLANKSYCSHSNRFSKHTNSPNFFWSCYNTSLNLENTVVTSNQFFYLKNLLLYQFFLSPPNFFFSLILSVFHIIQTQNTKQNPILKIKLNQNKQIWKEKKKKEQADLT